jgi:hypothetical protein
MLPIATNSTPNNTNPSKIRDLNDLDSLIGELSVPKEQINRTQPGAVPGSPSYDNPNEPAPELVESEKMSPEVAAMSGKMIANTIDTAVGTGLSLYAKGTKPEKYQATPRQLSNLEMAWAAVAAKYNYHVEDSPWFNALIQTGAVYVPHFQEAKNDRRFAQVNEALEELKAEMKKQSAALEVMKAAQQQTAAA